MWSLSRCIDQSFIATRFFIGGDIWWTVSVHEWGLETNRECLNGRMMRNTPTSQNFKYRYNSHYWIVTNSVLHSTLLVSMYRVSTDNGLTSLCALSHCPYTVLGTPKPPPDQHFPSCCKLSFSLRLSSAGLRRTWGSIHSVGSSLGGRPRPLPWIVLQKVKKAPGHQGCREQRGAGKSFHARAREAHSRRGQLNNGVRP